MVTGAKLTPHMVPKFLIGRTTQFRRSPSLTKCGLILTSKFPMKNLIRSSNQYFMNEPISKNGLKPQATDIKPIQNYNVCCQWWYVEIRNKGRIRHHDKTNCACS